MEYTFAYSEYKTIDEPDAKSFDDIINNLSHTGWTLIGPMTAVTINNQIHFVQMMGKADLNTEQSLVEDL